MHLPTLAIDPPAIDPKRVLDSISSGKDGIFAVIWYAFGTVGREQDNGGSAATATTTYSRVLSKANQARSAPG